MPPTPKRKGAKAPPSGERGAAEAGAVLAPTSWGNLVDRISILDIKCQRIRDPEAAGRAARERDALQAIRDRELQANPGIDKLAEALLAVNQRLWEIEDAIRDCERAQDFGPGFIELARSIYQLNDERARIKAKIDAAAGSAFTDVKQYARY